VQSETVKQKRILVVDDEKNIRFTVVHSLQNEELQVDSASSGVEGIKRFAEQQYDLLLIDLRMPGMTGIEMLREIRRGQHELPPAVIITAYGVPQQLVEAAQLGAIDYVRKPFSIQAIRATVRDIIDRARLPDDFIPSTPEEFLCKGKQELMLGKRNEALSHFQRAVELDSGLIEGLLLLGLGNLLEGSKSDARNWFRQALACDPANKTASEYLAWLADSQN
jgi:DNA-binding response OmpR family regulator